MPWSVGFRNRLEIWFDKTLDCKEQGCKIIEEKRDLGQSYTPSKVQEMKVFSVKSPKTKANFKEA